MEHLSLSQIVQIRDKARLILINKELIKSEKIGYLMALCQGDKGIGVDHLPFDVLRGLLYKEWDLLTKTLE